MSQIYEEDVLSAGKDQVIISNDNTKVIIVPELGGRIADVHSEEVKFLHRTYPDGVDFGPYTEYGGIEECIGGAPGALWNANWRWERKDDGVLLQALSKSILVRKHVRFADEAEPTIRIDYSFFNFGNNFSKFTFGIHPEVCIGGALKDNRYHVPTGGELLNGGYVEPGFKNKILPSEGWCAITSEGKVFGQMFPEGVIDTVEIYYPRVDTHMVLEPIIFGVGVSPDKCAGFTYMMYMGDGDAEKIREMRVSRDAEFSVRYEPFDRSELPEDVMAELGDMARDQANGEQRIKLGPGLEFVIAAAPASPQMSKFRPGPNFRPAFHPLRGTGRTGDLPPDTEIGIEHVKGNITIHGWERPYIEYANTHGKLRSREGTVVIEASGDYSLKVPRGTPKISLNFVKGNVAVFDVASSLEITGVKDKVDVVSAEVPDGGTLDISLVVGDINLSIPGDSSCSISATSLSGGEITCDLPLQGEERTRTQLSGVLNNGTAKILLNTTKGEISVSQVLDG
jgi:hypothetical protein